MAFWTRVFQGLFLAPGLTFAGAQAYGDAAPCGAFSATDGAMVCQCTGTESGSVWGSGPYTSDSNVCVAARHAGAVGLQGGVVTAFGVGGQEAYSGSTQNGVTTASWGRYGTSFDFRKTTAQVDACGRYPGGESAYQCACTGSEVGAVWGSNPYTADSNLCAAARHAGVIGSQGGAISVLGMGGLDSYSGSTANGVTTSNWGSYGTSVVFNLN